MKETYKTSNKVKIRIVDTKTDKSFVVYTYKKAISITKCTEWQIRSNMNNNKVCNGYKFFNY